MEDNTLYRLVQEFLSRFCTYCGHFGEFVYLDPIHMLVILLD